MSNHYTTVIRSLDTNVAAGTHVRLRIEAISAVDSFASRQIEDGLEALILEIKTLSLAGIPPWPASTGFEVIPEPIQKGLQGTTRIRLQLLEPRYRDVFRRFCDDICEVLADAESEEPGVCDFHHRLVGWQSFLTQHGPDGLSPEAQTGLFGELLVLRDVLLPHVASSVLVPAWRGCKKAQQDFQFRNYAIEVKTTRTTIPDRISISSVQQLDSEGIDSMVLTLVHVHANESAGESLPEITADLAGRLPDDICDLLKAGLQEVGYDEADREIYNKTRYQVLQLRHYSVREGFPRITRDQLADGIRKVRYEVGIDACKPFMIEVEDVISQLKKAGGCDAGKS